MYKSSKNKCKSTCLHVIALQKTHGSEKGESVFIPRIPMIPSDYQFNRVQFLVKMCFAMTINKSQGQTLKIAGINIREGEDYFSYGQFYVA